MAHIPNNLLPGRIDYPETVSYFSGYHPTQTETAKRKYFYHEICWLNKAGYLPLVSLFTGIYRLGLALLHLINQLVLGILESSLAKADRPYRQEITIAECGFALRHMARALMEIALPILGNAILYLADKLRRERFEKEMRDRLDVPEPWGRQAYLFINYEEIGVIPDDEFILEAKNLSSKDKTQLPNYKEFFLLSPNYLLSI